MMYYWITIISIIGVSLSILGLDRLYKMGYKDGFLAGFKMGFGLGFRNGYERGLKK